MKCCWRSVNDVIHSVFSTCVRPTRQHDLKQCCCMSVCRVYRTPATIMSFVACWRGSSQTTNSVNWWKLTTTQKSLNLSLSLPWPVFRYSFTGNTAFLCYSSATANLSLPETDCYQVCLSMSESVSAILCTPKTLWTPNLKNQWKEFHPILVTYLFGFIDVLIRFRNQKVKGQVTAGDDAAKNVWMEYLHNYWS